MVRVGAVVSDDKATTPPPPEREHAPGSRTLPPHIGPKTAAWLKSEVAALRSSTDAGEAAIVAEQRKTMLEMVRALVEIVKLLRVHLLVFGVLVLVLAGLAFGLFSTAHVGSDGIDLGGGHHGHHEGAEAPSPEAK